MQMLCYYGASVLTAPGEIVLQALHYPNPFIGEGNIVYSVTVEMAIAGFVSVAIGALLWRIALGGHRPAK